MISRWHFSQIFFGNRAGAGGDGPSGPDSATGFSGRGGGASPRSFKISSSLRLCFFLRNLDFGSTNRTGACSAAVFFADLQSMSVRTIDFNKGHTCGPLAESLEDKQSLLTTPWPPFCRFHPLSSNITHILRLAFRRNRDLDRCRHRV